jgi:hypothetical protein
VAPDFHAEQFARAQCRMTSFFAICSNAAISSAKGIF